MKRPRWLSACILGLIAGLGGESLLFFDSQCARIERVLRGDFRILLFVEGEKNAGGREVLMEKLRVLSDVEEVRYVSKEDALAGLRREEPELVEAVTLLGENPLNAAYEVRLAESGLGRVAQWIAEAQGLEDWADIRYKPAQVQAILQAEFYGRFLRIIMSAIVCLAAVLALSALWQVRRRAHAHSAWPFEIPGRAAWESLSAAGAGAAAGAGLVFMMLWPMRILTPWWTAPSAGGQAALLTGAAMAGWVLCGRGD